MLKQKRIASTFASICAKVCYEVVEYLIQKGHIRIAMISGEKDEINARIPRIKGYQRALCKYGISMCKEYLVEGNYTFLAGYKGAKKRKLL